jgi:hypothetical protein
MSTMLDELSSCANISRTTHPILNQFSYNLYYTNLYYKSEDNLNLFSPKSDPLYPSRQTYPSYVFRSGYGGL